MFYSFSRHAELDVKWANQFDASMPAFKWNHYNPYYQLIVAVDSPVRIVSNQERYLLRTGESLLLLPWEQHTGWNHNERQGTFFYTQFSCNPPLEHFETDAIPDLKQVHVEKTELRTETANREDLVVLPKLHLSKQRFQLLNLFEQLISKSHVPKGYFRFSQTLLLGEILRLIAADFLEQNQHDTAFPASYITYRKLVDFLNNGYERDVQKALLEQTMDRTYAYLCQVFKKYAGTTIIHYVHQLRVQRAKYLLFSSDKTVGMISGEVGYNDTFYFSRVFKRLAGLSPQQYRMQSRSPATE